MTERSFETISDTADGKQSNLALHGDTVMSPDFNGVYKAAAQRGRSYLDHDGVGINFNDDDKVDSHDKGGDGLSSYIDNALGHESASLNPNVQLERNSGGEVVGCMVKDKQGNWTSVPADANLDTLKVTENSIHYARNNHSEVIYNTEDGSETTQIGGTTIHRASPGAEPDRYKSVNGSVLEKHGDGKWWVKDEGGEWTAAGGKIITYTDGTIEYGGTGIASFREYALGGGDTETQTGSYSTVVIDAEAGKQIYETHQA